ncbi:MAG: shikimate dehydrogenase [Alphaproteobacteria bacterium]|nr:shikimate dehydrogenase [Alphaproteobacteria bacterium]
MIDGHTRLIAHIGYPTGTFKAPLIYNPYFDKHGINAVVVPMGCKAEDYAAFLPLVTRLSNFHGALITMPHKVTTLALLDTVSPTAAIAGSCNALRREADGRLVGDMFDGEGFVRGVSRKGRDINGKRAHIAGCGGVGSAIAASLARAGIGELSLFDPSKASMAALADRLKRHYPRLALRLGDPDPAGFDLVVNATPLGMKDDDPVPMDVSRIAPSALVGEVVLSREITPFLGAARARGCAIQVATDMLFEMIPAYLEFFGLPPATAEELRAVAELG